MHTVAGNDNRIDSLHIGRKCHTSSKSEKRERRHFHNTMLNAGRLDGYNYSLLFITTLLTFYLLHFQ